MGNMDDLYYDSDFSKPIQVALDLMKNHLMVLTDPAPSVVNTELADSSVNLQLRPWAEIKNYWVIKGEITIGFGLVVGQISLSEGQNWVCIHSTFVYKIIIK